MTQANNLLLSCAGRRVELLQILTKTLDRLGLGDVVAADAQPFAPAFAMAQKQAIVPRAANPQFISQMLDICRRENIRWIIPTIDTELPFLAQARDRFREIGVSVMVSDHETIRIAMDKRKTHEWFVSHGFPTFRQCSPQDALDSHDWMFPCFAKPADGSRSIGAARIESREQLKTRMESGLYDNDVIESLGSGFEVTADAYVSPVTGKCLCVIPRRRLEVRDGEVSKGKTVKIPEIMEIVKAVAEALPGAVGTICVQMFYNPEDHHIQLMEINPRFGGGYPLSEAAGAHFAQWFIQEDLGMPCTASNDWTPNLVMLRYDQSVFLQG